jgi:uncharacterized protein GlcG (DUF336 family)
MQPLTLAQANQMISAALSCAQEAGHRPMGVVVLDDAGHVKASQRQDGASMFRLDIARGKAWAAVGMGVNSRALSSAPRTSALFQCARRDGKASSSRRRALC